MKQSPDPLSPVPTRRLTSGGNRDLAAVMALFLANGLTVGVFGGSLPGLRAHLGLSAEQIVGVLVAAGLFAVASMNLSGPLADRIGARLPSLLGGTVMASGVVVMGAAPSYGWLVAGAAVFGLGNGAMDVSMNTLGVSVEQARRRPVMSRLHAFFSIGNLLGALVVVLLGVLLADDTPTMVVVGGVRSSCSCCWAPSPASPRSPPVVRCAATGPARFRPSPGCSLRWRSASG